MSDIAIKFENISKQYRLDKIGTGTLNHALLRRARKESTCKIDCELGSSDKNKWVSKNGFQPASEHFGIK
jgi:hypothetical protein